jgi:hypothetical protein
LKLKRAVVRSLPYVGIALTTVAWWWFGWKPAVEQPRHPDAALVRAVKARVNEVLEEPASARFRDVRYFPGSRKGCGEVNAKEPASARFRDVRYFPGSRKGCGEVNARKRSGDYAGYTLFVATPGGEVRFATAMPARDFLALLAASCPDRDLVERASTLVR